MLSFSFKASSLEGAFFVSLIQGYESVTYLFKGIRSEAVEY